MLLAFMLKLSYESSITWSGASLSYLLLWSATGAAGITGNKDPY
jgi:hypothetical protein